MMETDRNWKTKAFIVGGVIGALAGVGAAYLLVQQAERKGEPLRIGTGEGVRLGLLVLGLMRQVGRLGDREA